MKKDYPTIAKDLTQEIGALRQALPDTMKAFSALARSATEAKVLDVKTKELVACAIAIALRCDGCIAFHVKAARRAGCNREELLETIGMAIYMGGGPSMVYGAEALSAWNEFEAL
jgi:AhpD family alkylhydroperoxidase